MIQLKKTREWSGEHKEDDVTGTVRLYIGSLFCGVAIPVRGEIDNYFFYPSYDCIPSLNEAAPLEAIKMMVELTLKEFASQFCYTRLRRGDEEVHN